MSMKHTYSETGDIWDQLQVRPESVLRSSAINTLIHYKRIENAFETQRARTELLIRHALVVHVAYAFFP